MKKTAMVVAVIMVIGFSYSALAMADNTNVNTGTSTGSAVGAKIGTSPSQITANTDNTTSITTPQNNQSHLKNTHSQRKHIRHYRTAKLHKHTLCPAHHQTSVRHLSHYHSSQSHLGNAVQSKRGLRFNVIPLCPALAQSGMTFPSHSVIPCLTRNPGKVTPHLRLNSSLPRSVHRAGSWKSGTRITRI